MASVLLDYEKPGIGNLTAVFLFGVLMSEQAQIILMTTESTLVLSAQYSTSVPSQLSL